MSGRATAEIVADLREVDPTGRDITGLLDEAAGRLADLDAENSEQDDRIAELAEQNMVLTDHLGTLDALRLPCPTCGGTQVVTTETRDDDQGRGEVLIRTSSIPCPDCTDGRMSWERMAKIVAAVFDDQPYDDDLPTEITFLRGVR